MNTRSAAFNPLTHHEVQHDRGRKRGGPALLALVLALLLCVANLTGDRSSAHAAAIHVDLDTTTLAGLAGRLEFDLFDGDFILGDNTVTVSNIVTNGALTGADCSIGCTGGPPYRLDDAFGFGQFLQDLTLGTRVGFDLNFTTNFVSSGGNAPDRLALFLLDPDTNFTLVDTNLDLLSDPVPFEDALLVIDLVGRGIVQVATVTSPQVIVAATPLPEPDTWALLALALLVLVASQRRSTGLKLRSKYAGI